MEAETALRDLNETLEQRVEVEVRERSRIWNVSQDLLLVADMRANSQRKPGMDSNARLVRSRFPR